MQRVANEDWKHRSECSFSHAVTIRGLIHVIHLRRGTVFPISLYVQQRLRSDQHAHTRSLIRAFTEHTVGSQVSKASAITKTHIFKHTENFTSET